MNDQEKAPFIISQLEEALEERQNSDRRRDKQPLQEGIEERRKGDRRQTEASE